MTGTTTFSYSYQAVFDGGGKGPTMMDSSQLIIAADRTNAQAGIHELSQNHGGEWMNVLKLDAHVERVETNGVGIDGDNIFTSSGTAETDPNGDLTSPHTSRKDSYLVGP